MWETGDWDGRINEMASGHIYDVIWGERHRFIGTQNLLRIRFSHLVRNGIVAAVRVRHRAREWQPNGSTTPFVSQQSFTSTSKKINMSTLMSNYTISVALFSP